MLTNAPFNVWIGRLGHVSDFDSMSVRQYPVDWKKITGDENLKRLLTGIIGAVKSEDRWQLQTKRSVIRIMEHLDKLIVA